ncbi:MAG TPA: DinB family protein [Candidatus Eisenbacteria bacterium]|jgi:uncharacterized damage-inducible protein DinB
MSNEVSRIEDQLKRAFEGNAWHGPALKEVLQGVTAPRAAAKPIAGAHSIWEIVYHVAAWEDVVRRRLAGEPVALTDAEDWPPVRDTGDAAWSSALEGLSRGHQALRRAVSKLSDAKLKEEVPGMGYSIYHLVHGVIQHDLYHAGQIALLKKGS